MKPNTHFLSYLAEFFIEWEMFWTKVVKKFKTHILGSGFLGGDHAFYEIS
jgi:hypothetical protein